MAKLWDKGHGISKQIESFTVGNDYMLDQKLVKYDCLGSIAHAKMLKKIGILTSSECEQLIATLQEIVELDSKGKFAVKLEDEDCHTAIENYLVEKLGDAGKKIHTARSRNDQVLTALRLYYKEEALSVLKMIELLVKALLTFKEKYGGVEMPGYTHMRKAMPSSVGLWAESFIQSMNDNTVLLQSMVKLIDRCPLGTGAGYGLPIRVDRKMTSDLLGFEKVQESPLYVQNSRGKFEGSLLHSLSQILFDLNKMASDIILFSMPEFGYFELAEEHCTGSSIMPHKKNPDVMELVRAKYHQVLAYEFQTKSLIANLISGYNRDLQLTKEPVMKGFEITKSCLAIMAPVIEKLEVSEEHCKKAMTEELYTVKAAHELVKKGIPFRKAYAEISQQFK